MLMSYEHIDPVLLQAYSGLEASVTEMFYLTLEIEEERKRFQSYRAQHLRQVEIKHENGLSYGQQSMLDSLARKCNESLQKVQRMETRMDQLRGSVKS